MEGSQHVEISQEPLRVDLALAFCQDSGAGAINVFVGTVRNRNKGKAVTHLEFEAYEPMAISEMNKLVANAFEQWDITKVYLAHRIGAVGIGDLPVVIAVSSTHRKAGFLACEYLIDSLKATVPIWKKEHYGDGALWVSATP